MEPLFLKQKDKKSLEEKLYCKPHCFPHKLPLTKPIERDAIFILQN